MLRRHVDRSLGVLFLAIGAAYGTSKAGIGIAGLGHFKPELIMKVRISTPQFKSPPHPKCELVTVPHPRRHVRYYCGLRPRGLRTNCGGA
jgi:hypothetical protein